MTLVAREAEAMGFALYMVGGFPRDLVLRRVPADYDLVVEGDAIQLARRLQNQHGGGLITHTRFRTAKWRVSDLDGQTENGPHKAISEHDVDLISARSESYDGPAKLPRVRLGMIEDDLRRRDFTVNTLAIRLNGPKSGAYFDPLGARADIRHRLIRVLHDRSFQDDPTRVLRAVRYEKRLGFKIEARTLGLIVRSRRAIRLVTGARLRNEIERILAEDRAAAMLMRLGGLGVLTAIHKALPSERRVLGRLARARNAHPQTVPEPGAKLDLDDLWRLWLLDLSPSQISAVGTRLSLGRQLVASMRAAADLRRRLARLSALRPRRIAEQLDSYPPTTIRAVLAAAPAGRGRRTLQAYLSTWRQIRPLTTGKDLRQMGIPASPIYKAILRELRGGWIEGEIMNAAQEQTALRRLVDRSLGRAVPNPKKRNLQPRK